MCAWAVVAAALVATTVLLGLSCSFGVLMGTGATEFDTGCGAASVAFSLTVGLPFLLAPLAVRAWIAASFQGCPLMDHGA